MKTYAIIVAGGTGSRMKTTVPKQFHVLTGRPILALTIQAFADAIPDIHVVLVVPREHLQTADSIAETFTKINELTVTIGGATRFESVKNGLRLVPPDAMVFVHDGVRCLVTPALIRRCLQQALLLGNAIPAISPVDSLRMETQQGNEQIDRRKVKLIQTPQTFKSELLKRAYDQPYVEAFTDDASVLEAMGEPIHLVEGESTNIKITLPFDLVIAREILKQREASDPTSS